MFPLPLELLGEIANQGVLSNKDLTSLARVNHRFHEAACARLYRSGELSYVGATDKDIAKVDSYRRNGKFVRILKLDLFSLPTSQISIPTAIFPLLKSFVNLHRIHLTDSASLPWPAFLHVIAIIITSHPYLKILEIQRTLTTDDGRSDITPALSLVEEHKANRGVFAKLDVFILRLSKKEGPYLISRAALNNLITVLLPSTRSAKAFTYSSDSFESPDIDLKDPKTGKDFEPLSWEWDRLEELTLKLPENFSTIPGILSYNMSYQRDLQNVKRLALKARTHDLLSQGPGTFIGGLTVMPDLECIRISHMGSYLDWNTNPHADHPFVGIAAMMPKLRFIERTDPYFLTRTLQCLKITRIEDGSLKFKDVVPTEPWIGYYEWDY